MTRSLFPSTVWELSHVYGGSEFGAGPVLKCCEYEIAYEKAKVFPSSIRIKRLELARVILERRAQDEAWKSFMGR